MNLRLVRLAAASLAVALLAVPAAEAKSKNKHVYVVCEHGCKYRTIQKGVNKAKGKKNAVVKVKPGKYVEGVQVSGSKYNGLTIKGTKDNPRKTILDGTNAQLPGGVGIANNGIQVDDAAKVTIKNLWIRDYAANGVFLRDSNAENDKRTCKNFEIDNVDVSFNLSYGLFAFGCVGGTFENSEGWGHGDSAYYIGGTPVQNDPKTTVLKNLESYENVLGYSGTNSKYVVIKGSAFYNNGVGVLPNTLDSEPYEPSGDSVIRDNEIFWNNFNYYLPASEVKTVSNGLGTLPPELGGGTLQSPTGIGVGLFGSDGWTVKNNQIFGNFMWGVAEFSDPFNDGDDAISRNNRVIDNSMGRAGSDPNGHADFWVDGSGGNNCFSGNDTSTFAPTTDASATLAELYPECPVSVGSQPNAGATGASFGNVNMQIGQLVPYVAADPPDNQECAWVQQPHPAFGKYEPLDVTPGPDCGP